MNAAPPLFHPRAHSAADGNACGIEVVEAEDVDAEVIGCDALAVERVDAARLAEEVTRRMRMEAILGKRVLTGQKLEPRFVHLDHQRVLAPADRAVARGELGKIGLDAKRDRTAVAAPVVRAHRAGHVKTTLLQCRRLEECTASMALPCDRRARAPDEKLEVDALVRLLDRIAVELHPAATRMRRGRLPARAPLRKLVVGHVQMQPPILDIELD